MSGLLTWAFVISLPWSLPEMVKSNNAKWSFQFRPSPLFVREKMYFRSCATFLIGNEGSCSLRCREPGGGPSRSPCTRSTIDFAWRG